MISRFSMRHLPCPKKRSYVTVVSKSRVILLHIGVRLFAGKLGIRNSLFAIPTLRYARAENSTVRISMKRILLFALLLVTFSALTAAQAPGPAAKISGAPGEWGKNQLYVGFAWEPTDFVSDWGSYKGIAVDYTRHLAKHISAVADFDWARNNVTDRDGLDPNLAHNSSDYNFRVGPRFDVLSRAHRLQPYGVFLFGGGHFTSVVPANYPPTMWHQANWFGFTWAAGGGVDVRITPRFGVRGEWLHTREPWGTGLKDQADWDRITFGGAWRF